MRTYLVNEVFRSIQGEGLLAGTPMTFVRFARCNLRCALEPGDRSPGGFDCDTEFESGRRMTSAELLAAMRALAPAATSVAPWALLTGGEPGLQVDRELLEALRDAGYRLAIETNGSVALDGFELYDHVTVSPKVAAHAIRQKVAHELRLVRGDGQELLDFGIAAAARFVSPATLGDGFETAALRWCIALVLAHPDWRLSVQQHKLWRIR